MTRVISIINLKGGVGKTFTAANMAHILNFGHGKSVLLVDNDKQGNLSKLFSAYQDETESGAAKLLRGWYQDVNSLRVPLPGYPCMDIIPANMSLLQATNDLTREESEDQIERFRALAEAYPLEEGKPYDFIIIDNPPDLGLNVINALAVSDDVIVPTKVDAWALAGLDVIIEQVEQMKQLNSRLQFRGVLPTMWQNTDTNISGMEWLQEKGYKVFESKIWYSAKAPESTFFCQPIVEYAPRSWTAIKYRKFVAEYLGEIEAEQAADLQEGKGVQ